MKKKAAKKTGNKCGNTTRHYWMYHGTIIKCTKCGKVADPQDYSLIRQHTKR